MTLRRSPPCGASLPEEPTANAVLMVSEALAFTGRTSWADVVRAYKAVNATGVRLVVGRAQYRACGRAIAQSRERTVSQTPP